MRYLWVVVLTGCGPSEDAFLDRAARLTCDWDAECGDPPAYESVEACVDAVDDVVIDPDCTFIRPEAKECLRDLADLDCGTSPPPESCSAVYECPISDTFGQDVR